MSVEPASYQGGQSPFLMHRAKGAGFPIGQELQQSLLWRVVAATCTCREFGIGQGDVDFSIASIAFTVAGVIGQGVLIAQFVNDVAQGFLQIVAFG
jgi:hypothetical protein